MILYHQNNSYLKFKSSFINFRLSPNDVCLSVFNFTLSSFSLPANCCLQSCTVEKRKVLVNCYKIILCQKITEHCCLLRKFMIVTDYLV